MSNERTLNDEIVWKLSECDGPPESLFGAENEITRFGRFFSLNRGLKVGGRELIVLDTEDKSIKRYIFSDDPIFLQRQNGRWIGERFPIDPRKTTGVNVDYLFRVTDEFICKRKQIIPGLERNEAKRVTSALSVGVEPLLSYYREQLEIVKKRVRKLSSIK